jgi:single-stranded-DNA-specific exonuclease
MEIRKENLGPFREAFLQEARNALIGEDLRPELKVDLEVRLGEMTPELHDLLRYLGPHGMGNPRPVFLARSVGMAGPARVVGSNHLKLRITQGSAGLEAIGFNLADRIDPRTLGAGPLDVAFQLQENEFRGVTTLQARLKDLRSSALEGP